MSSKNSQCETFVPMLDAFVDNELEGSEKEQVVSHIQACDDCKRQVKEIEALKVSLASLPRRKMSRDLADNLDSILGAQDKSASPAQDNVVPLNKKRGWAVAVASAAAVIVIALAGSIVSKNGHQPIANLPSEKQPAAHSQAPSLNPTEIADRTATSPVKNEADRGGQPENQMSGAAAQHSADASVKIASGGSRQDVIGKREDSLSVKAGAAQKTVAIHQNQSAATTVASNNDSSKAIVHKGSASSELLALYEEDEGIGSDIGMTTDEDGLYAIKL